MQQCFLFLSDEKSEWMLVKLVDIKDKKKKQNKERS